MQIKKIHADQPCRISQPKLIVLLGYSRSKFYTTKRDDPHFPKPDKEGKSRQASVYYFMTEVEDWLESKKAARGAV